MALAKSAIPLTAIEKDQKISSSLGSPNWQWSNIAMGSAPTATILRQHSASTLADPRYGSKLQKLEFPSSLIAANLPFGNFKTAASASPGLAIVLIPTS